MIAPRLSRNANGVYDMYKENGKFLWAADGVQAAQQAGYRLLTFKGELSHGGKLTTKTELGTDWYGKIFPMDVDQATKELEMKRRIYGPGIEAITEWQWTQSSHTVSIVCKALTSWGEIDMSGEYTPL